MRARPGDTGKSRCVISFQEKRSGADKERGENLNTDVMFSSKTDNWATPQEFFDELNREFHFDLDPAADENNHKCDKYFTVKENGLLQSWGGIFCILQSPVWAGDRKVG